jgi:hypothetical protein
MVPDEITEDEIDDLPLESVMAVDRRAVCDQLVARLTALPYPAYLRCMASYIDDLRAYYGREVFGEGERLVRKTSDLIRAAADGQPVATPLGLDAQRLMDEWLTYMGNPDDSEDAGDMVETDLPGMLLWTCTATIEELLDPVYRHDAADVVSNAALKVKRRGDASPTADSRRFLLKFSARAKGQPEASDLAAVRAAQRRP